jgi:hypothetical protein
MQQQKIVNPVVARFRAFSWPNKNVGGPITPFPETDAELLQHISAWENGELKGKRKDNMTAIRANCSDGI